MTWSFGTGGHTTAIISLVAAGVVNGAKLELACSGRGCKFKSRTSIPPTPKARCAKGKTCSKPKQSTTDSLTGLFKGWRLGPKATLTISIVRSGYVGKVYIFSMRPPHSPAVTITCLAPGAKTPGAGC
jgi:hypothetical protein